MLAGVALVFGMAAPGAAQAGNVVPQATATVVYKGGSSVISLDRPAGWPTGVLNVDDEMGSVTKDGTVHDCTTVGVLEGEPECWGPDKATDKHELIAFRFVTSGHTATGVIDCREEGDLVDRNPNTIVHYSDAVLRGNRFEIPIRLCEGSVGKTFEVEWNTSAYIGRRGDNAGNPSYTSLDDPDNPYEDPEEPYRFPVGSGDFPGERTEPFDAAAAHCGATRCATTVTIVNDGPDASFASGSSSAAEDDGTVNVTVNLAPAPDRAIEVGYAVESASTATAGAGNDFTVAGGTAGTVSVAPNQASVSIPVDIRDDGDDENDETVVLTLTAGAGYRPAGTTRHTLTIEDNDTPAASFATGASSAAEGAGARNVTIGISPAPANGISIGYTVGGTATAGSGDDYTIAGATGATGTVDVAAGATSAVIAVTINDDAVAEDAETVILTLTAGTGYALGGTAEHTLTIEDDDTPAASFATGVSSAAEGAGARNVTIGISPAPANGISIGYTVGGTATAGSGDDYTIAGATGATGTVDVAAGATSAVIAVTINDDAVAEDAETVILTLTAGTGYRPAGTTRHTLTIVDNEPEVSFATGVSSAAEGAGARDVTIDISPAPASDISIGYTVGGTATRGSDGDFTIAGFAGDGNAGTVTVTAGSTSADIPVRILDDAVAESAETVILTLAGGTGYALGGPTVHTISIEDNEPEVSVGCGGDGSCGQIGEGDMASFVVSSDTAVTRDVEVPVRISESCLQGQDCSFLPDERTQPRTIRVTIPNGRMEAGFDIPTENDDVHEPDGRITAALVAESGGGDSQGDGIGRAFSLSDVFPVRATIVVADDDDPAAPPSVSFEKEGEGVYEGQTQTVDVAVKLSREAPEPGLTIGYSVGGTAGEGVGADFTIVNRGSVAVPAGATGADIPVTVYHDTTAETAVETVELTLNDGAGYTAAPGAAGRFVLRIADDADSAGIDRGSLDELELTEGGAAERSGTWQVRLTSEPLGEVTVTVTSADDAKVKVNAQGGTPGRVATLKFGGTSGNPWNAGQTITVTAQDDSDGDDEAVIIGHRASGYGSVTGSSKDDIEVKVLDDEPPRLFFAMPASRRLETVPGNGVPTATDNAGYYRQCAALPARIELSSRSDSAIQLRYAVAGTATYGSDYETDTNLNRNTLEGTIAIPAGRKCAAIPVAIDNDNNAEGDETIVLTLQPPGAGAGYTVDSLRNRHTVTIEDNEGGVIVEPTTVRLTEGGEVGEYTVRLTSDPGRSVTVSPRTADPGAVAVSGLLIFGGGIAGNWRRPQTIRVAPVDDQDPNDETVVITHTIVGYGDATVPDVTVEVADDDAAAASPVVTINAGGPVDEGGVANFTLTATPRPLANIIVNVAVGQEGDFAAAGQVQTWPVSLGGDGQATLAVRTDDDGADEPDGAITATIVNGQNYTVATAPSHTARVAVRDNDDPPPPAAEASFLADRSSAAEHAGTHSVLIGLVPPPAETIALTYRVLPSSTAGDADYTLHNMNPATMTAAVAVTPGAAQARIPVTIDDDRESEGSETLIFELVPGDGYTVGPGSRHTMTITDNDNLGVTVAPLELSLEEGGTASYTVVLDTDPGAGARVTVTPSVGDPGAVAISPQALTFDSGNWSRPQGVNVSGVDDDDDNHETVAIGHTVSGYGNGVAADSVTVEVVDDDYVEPVVSIAGGEAVEEGGWATFTLTAQPPPRQGIVVNVSVVSSGDFARLGQDGSRLVSIGASGRSVLSVATEDDGVLEEQGAISAVLGAGEGYSVALPPDHSARVAVSDNDAPPADSVASFRNGMSEAREGMSEACGGMSEAREAEAADGAVSVHCVTIAIGLDPAAEQGFTLRYTVAGNATLGADYDIVGGVDTSGAEAVGEVAVSEGDDTATIEVTVRDDDSYEPGEAVVLTLIGGRGYEVGANATHTLSIGDDDRASGLQVQAEATMARLGRSLTEQWMQGVSDRLASRQRAAAPTAAEDPFQLAIAGRTDWFDPETGWRTRGLALPPAGAPPPPPPPAGMPPSGERPAGAMDVSVVGVSGVQAQDRPSGGSGTPSAPGAPGPGTPAPGVGAPAPDSGGTAAPAEGGDDSGGRFRNLLRGVFSNSSFQARGPQLGGGSLGFWGRGATSAVAGGADRFAMDADMTSALLGADWTGVWLTMGVMVSSGSGDGAYTAGNIAGDLELNLTGITPYMGYQWGERTSIWGALNASGGELTLRPRDGGGADTDLSTLSFAAGGRSELYAGAQGLSLSVLADVLAVSAETGAIAGLEAVDAGASRLRLSLEGAWSRALPGAGRIRTHLEAGLRGDGGDAEEGFGAEVAAGVSWTSGAGITVELAGRGLAVHADETFEQSGASLYISWDSSPDTPLGPTLSMRQGQGADPGGGARRLQGAGGLAALGAGAEAAGASGMERMDVELGWGLPWRRERYVLTPTLSHGRLGAGGRETGVGWRLAPGELNGLDLSAGLRAAWRELPAQPGPDASDAERTLAMDVRVRW